MNIRSGPDAGAYPHNIHGAVDGSLVQMLKIGRYFCYSGRHLQNVGFKICFYETPIGNSTLNRIFSAQGIALQHEFHGRTHAHHPGLIFREICGEIIAGAKGGPSTANDRDTYLVVCGSSSDDDFQIDCEHAKAAPC